jgi:hypothetical protein
MAMAARTRFQRFTSVLLEVVMSVVVIVAGVLLARWVGWQLFWVGLYLLF